MKYQILKLLTFIRKKNSCSAELNMEFSITSGSVLTRAAQIQGEMQYMHHVFPHLYRLS